MKKDFAFLLVTYKNSKDTNHCIHSILDQLKTSSLTAEIMIFDNSPKIGKYPSNVKVFGTGINTGFAYSCNLLAVKASKVAKNLVFLNNDTELQPKFIHNLSKLKSDFGKNIAICPQIFDAKGNIWFSGGNFRKNICRPETSHLNLNQRTETELLTGCCIIISSKNWQESGGFDENFFLYYEDVDWSLRVSSKLKLYVDPNLKITHYTHSSTGHKNGPIQIYYQTRNNLYLAQKLHKLFYNIPYMALLSAKRILNLLLYKSPYKKRAFKFIFIAWKDFLTHNYGQGSFLQK